MDLTLAAGSQLFKPIIYLAGVLVCGTAAQWLAWKLRIPAIVLLLAVGFGVGQLVPPDEYIPDDLLFPLVSLAVAIILFEGGLSLRFREIRETGTVVLRLVTVGLMVTWIGTAAAAWALLDFSLGMAALCGALLTVSGPTVILPMLRHVRPTRRIGSLIKWEGIVNDPIGAVLAALVFEVVAHQTHGSVFADTIWGLTKTILVGVVLGGATALLIWQIFRRYWVPDHLQNPIVLTLVLMVFAISNQIQHEAGLVTVTILGVALANQRTVSLQHIVEFKENLRVLLICTLFIVLASRVQIGAEQLEAWGGWSIWELALRAIAFLAVLLVIVRPLSVIAATAFSKMNWREKTLLAWIHPRGIVAAAVSSLFALNLVRLANGDDAASAQAEGDQLVLVTFWVIVGTVTVYGLTLAPLARWLKLSSQNPQGVMFAGATPMVREIALALHKEGFRTLLVDNNHANIATARMAGLPVLYASIGSEYAREEADLGDIGRLLAMTPNDQVNALAGMEFVEHFGRKNIFQLQPPDSHSERQEQVGAHRRGRTLFAMSITFQELSHRFSTGQVIKKTMLTDDFTLDDFLQRYTDAIVMFVVEDGRLHICASDDDFAPKAGQKLIALVEDKE